MAPSLSVCVGIGAAAAGFGLVAGGWSYASLSPRSTLFGRALTAPRQPGELALTFDDGPNPACTPALLDMLASHEIHATFFLMGSRAHAEPALVRRMVAEGHLIGNHSWSHPNLARTSALQIREELTRTSDTLQQITGKPVRYFRPPFGGRRPVVFRIARELGLEPVLWNAMTSDWREPSAKRIAESLMRKIEHNRRCGRATNIVMHDGGHLDPRANRQPSLSAASMLVERYKSSNRFVTVDAWG